MSHPRRGIPQRGIDARIGDWRDIYLERNPEESSRQASRCMGCGIPFCHTACPLGNKIPDFNRHLYGQRWEEALRVLHSTNNFPEFTGRICPAPCEESCVLAINTDPVTIEHIEREIADWGFENGHIRPEPPAARTGFSVAVIGSGPAGLAAAQQLNRCGHRVVVFERDEYPGGLLTLGIPDFKLEKDVVFRRVDQLEQEGVEFRTGVNVGADIDGDELRARFDAICLATGANYPRSFTIPGYDMDGVVYAMDYLCQQIRRNLGQEIPDSEFITARDKKVVIIGGGDTAADCLGTAIRQGASQIHQFDIHEWPEQRAPDNPWPYWPAILRTRTTPAHHEGGTRNFNVLAQRLAGADNRVQALEAIRLAWGEKDDRGRPRMIRMPGSEFSIEVDLVLVAIGFAGPHGESLLGQLGVGFDARGMVAVDEQMMSTTPGVFACGDVHRGMSLVVWAIAHGRDAARGIDRYLTGRTDLPASAVTGELGVGR